MLQFKDLTFSYEGGEAPVLQRLNLSYSPGELALICGPTGSGKSTLLRAVTGLIPHFTGGQLTGSIRVRQSETSHELVGRKPHEIAELVGYVNQQPEQGFVADTVTAELAFGMEQLGRPRSEMLRLIPETLEQFGLTKLADRELASLSGGEQQRVAVAAALCAGARVLLLDEPTSALDSASAKLLLEELRRIAQTGITVLLAEHRIERALEMVDSVTVVHGDGSASKALVSEGLDPVLRDMRVVPPVIELGKFMGWQPLPLTIHTARDAWSRSRAAVRAGRISPAGPQLLAVDRASMRFGDARAVNEASFELAAGQICALLGPNGAGKSSLLNAIWSGPTAGQVWLPSVSGQPNRLSPALRAKHIAYVPQDASDLLLEQSISAELTQSDEHSGATPGTTAKLFSALAGRQDPQRHPRDLSAGQQLALVLAMQLAGSAQVVMLDEPTRGLDYEAKRQLGNALRLLKSQGKAILVATHDVEFVANTADLVMHIADGQLSPARSVFEDLPGLGEAAPQLSQITGSALRLSQVVS